MQIWYSYRKKFVRKGNKIVYDGKEYDSNETGENMTTLIIGIKELDEDYSI